MWYRFSAQWEVVPGKSRLRLLWKAQMAGRFLRWAGWCAAYLVFFLGVILLAETAVRAFTSVHLQGVSKELFARAPDEAGYVNMANARAVAFGVAVVTDGSGYRIRDGYDYPDGETAVLIVGDSVAFGVALEEHRTLAGRLRDEFPTIPIYNASVIGHGTVDYLATVKRALATHPNIAQVYLIFTLNDLASASRRNIARSLEEDATPEGGLVLVERVNGYLRGRSKLFIVLKNLYRDASMQWFEADLKLYDDAGLLDQAIGQIEEIKSHLQERGVNLLLVVPPYEAQLRPDNAALRWPQQLLAQGFAQRGIDLLDLMDDFLSYGDESADYYLFADHMHLSERGHDVLFGRVSDHLKTSLDRQSNWAVGDE